MDRSDRHSLGRRHRERHADREPGAGTGSRLDVQRAGGGFQPLAHAHEAKTPAPRVVDVEAYAIVDDINYLEEVFTA